MSNNLNESNPLKRHWDSVRSQEAPSKKSKVDQKLEALEAIFLVDSAIDDWTIKTLHNKEKREVLDKPARLILLNLENVLFKAINKAHQDLHDLYVPKKVLKSKGAVLEADDSIVEPIKYKVQWVNEAMKPSWEDEQFMKSHKDVLRSYWLSYGITFVDDEEE